MSTNGPVKRRRGAVAREEALEAARDLLLSGGPAAVTLKAVAARIDRTHANLLHHFGSAAGLQKALAAYQAETVCDTIGRKMAESPPGERNVREIVDLAFDAFNEGGAGALATWMAATGNDDALDPIVDAIHRLIDGMGFDPLDMASMIAPPVLRKSGCTASAEISAMRPSWARSCVRSNR